jgi:hypothetical protein
MPKRRYSIRRQFKRKVNKTTKRRGVEDNKRFKGRRQQGGEVTLFHVFVFTREPISSLENEQLLGVFRELYGPNVEVNDEMMTAWSMRDFVDSKGKHYPRLETVTGFEIKDIPKELNTGSMNDAKLTKEEYKIRDALSARSVPFKLIEAEGPTRDSHGHGQWGADVALIGLEHI